MRFVTVRGTEEIAALLRGIGVDPYGIRIMAPKAAGLVLQLDGLTTIAANILKQEMLSFGAEAAVARHALTGSKKLTPCILIGNRAHFARLLDKLRKQPFGLAELAVRIENALENIDRTRFAVPLRSGTLTCGKRTLVMAIANATPDSFSGDGLYRGDGVLDPGFLENLMQGFAADGADIIDIGGESSRPGARAVSAKEQSIRVLPLIRAAKRSVRIPVSIDTRSPDVAQRALDAGADIVNDISGLRNKRMRAVVAKAKAAVVLMHMRGTPATMQRSPAYADVVADVIAWLERAARTAESDGIAAEKIIIDPGIGFGKTTGHNLALLRRLREFTVLGKPILVGTSRKSFIAALTNAQPHQRGPGTIASCVAAAMNGAHIVRVHDVKAARDALAVCDAITGKNRVMP